MGIHGSTEHIGVPRELPSIEMRRYRKALEMNNDLSGHAPLAVKSGETIEPRSYSGPSLEIENKYTYNSNKSYM